MAKLMRSKNLSSKSSKKTFAGFQSQSGVSLLSVIIAVGMMGVLAAGMSRFLKRSFKASADLNTKADYLSIKRSIDGQIDCSRTVNKINVNQCDGAGNDYVGLYYHGKTNPQIPRAGRRFGNFFVRAKCTNQGLDVRAVKMHTSVIQNLAPNDPRKRFDYNGGNYQAKNASNAKNFFQDMRGFYFNWGHPNAKLFGDVGNSIYTPCQNQLNNKLNPPTSGPINNNEVFGGTWAGHCSPVGGSYQKYCRMFNTKYPSLGCACPNGYDEVQVLDYCLSAGDPVNGYAQPWCGGQKSVPPFDRPSGYSSKALSDRYCGLQIKMCITKKEVK